MPNPTLYALRYRFHLCVPAPHDRRCFPHWTVRSGVVFFSSFFSRTVLIGAAVPFLKKRFRLCVRQAFWMCSFCWKHRSWCCDPLNGAVPFMRTDFYRMTRFSRLQGSGFSRLSIRYSRATLTAENGVPCLEAVPFMRMLSKQGIRPVSSARTPDGHRIDELCLASVCEYADDRLHRI